MSASEAKRASDTYYVCQSLMKRGSGTCKTPRLNAKKIETTIVGELRANILTESNIRELVKHLDEELDGAAREHRQKLESIETELEAVKKQLGRVWHFISKSDNIGAAASDHIVDMRERRRTWSRPPSRAVAGRSGGKVPGSADTIATFAERCEFPRERVNRKQPSSTPSSRRFRSSKQGAIIYWMPTPMTAR